MTTDEPTPAAARVGWVLSGLAILFLLFDTGIKLAVIRPVIETLDALGWPNDRGTILGLGIGLAIATILYAVPRTALIGALLLTGYLGGAIATHARIGSPTFSHTLFGVYLAVLVWGGLWLRMPALRALVRGASHAR